MTFPSKKYAKYLQHLKENIMYEDKNLLVFNKPAGLATQGGNKVDISLDDLLVEFKNKIGEKPRLTHRLDKETTGLIITAKNKNYAKKIAKFFEERKINKTYLALVRSCPHPKEDIIKLPLIKRATKTGKEIICTDSTKNAKIAITKYKVLQGNPRTYSLVSIKPVTGRKHQIRVHFAAIGHPIIGDGKYGGKNAFLNGMPNKIQLHSYKIHIKNYNLNDLIITAPAPSNINEILAANEKK
jgi:23S rRNA pseudouridine955/2504/2580 synthase